MKSWQKELRKKVLFSVLTAGILSTCVMGSVGAEEYNDGVSVDSDSKTFQNLVINSDNVDAGEKRVFGLIGDKANLELNGNTIIGVEENDSSGKYGAAGIILRNNSNLEVNNNLTVSGITNYGKLAVGLLDSGSNVSNFYGTTLIDIKNNNLLGNNKDDYNGWLSARSVGIALQSGASTNFYGDVTIKAEGYAYSQGIFAHQTNTVFYGNTTIEAASTRENYYGLGDDVRVIDLEGDPTDNYNTIVEFCGDSTVIKGTGNIVAGILSSGGPDKIFTKFTGKRVDIVTNGDTRSHAIISQYNAQFLSSAETDMNIVANSKKGEAIGILAEEYTKGSGMIEILGNTNVVANGLTGSFAVWSSEGSDVTLGSTGKTVSLTGDVVADNGTITLQGSDNTINGVITATNSGEVKLTGEAATYNLQHMEASDSGKITVGAGTTIAVDSAHLTGNNYLVTLSADGSIEVGSDAKIKILNAKKGQTFNIVEGSDEEAWKVENISADNFMLQYEKKDDSSNYIITTTVADAAKAFNGAVIIPDVLTQTFKRQNAGDAAFDFFNAAADSKIYTKEQAAKAINNAASMSELAGVSRAAYSASNILTDAVAGHMSLAKNLDHDTDIWAHYVHTKENIDGLAVANGGARYDAQYNGVVVGADLYKQGKGVVGAALTYIDGKVSGSTRNEAEYYGLSVYGGVQNEDSAVTGDISYLHGKNEITQYNSGYTLTGKPKSDAFSIGVRAEQSFKAGAGKIVPYAGLRYMHLGTGNYTNSIGLHYDADDADLFLLPVGVKYSAEHKTAGWTLRPIAEVGYVWAMGDRDSKQTVSLNGTGNGFGYDVTDSGSYIARLALEAEKANVTYGLGYEYQKGDSVKANKWMVNLNWAF